MLQYSARYFPLKGAVNLYTIAIRPVLEYGSEINGDIKCHRFAKIEKDMLRTILGQPSFASVAMMYHDADIIDIKLRRETRMLMYWGKLIRMPNIRHPKVVLILLNNAGNKISWDNRIRKILTRFKITEQDARNLNSTMDE